MARIRSIKPEFWADEDNLGMSDSCALFFIGLWNFCDDEGKHRLGLKQICAELGGRWRKDKASLYLLCLAKSGQIRVSMDSEWIQITGWSHQKIDKPRQPEVKASEITWLSKNDSTKALESSSNVRRKDRIGEDTIGVDRISCEAPLSAEPAPPPSFELSLFKSPKITKEKTDVSKVWDAYKHAYKNRYGSDPTWNAKVAGQLKQFCDRVPKDEAPDIAAFFLGHGNGFYVARMHPVGQMLTDAEKLRTEWLTGRKMTSASARGSDVAATAEDQLRRIAEGSL